MRLVGSHRHWIMIAARVAAVICAGAIAFLSLGPPPQAVAAPGSDKLGHMLAYFALTSLMLTAWPGSRWQLPAALAFAYGAMMEVGQALGPHGREASLLDLAANAAGVGGAVIGFMMLRRLLA